MRRGGCPHERGFSLIELLVTVAVLGALSGAVVFAVGGVTDRGSESACASDLATLRRAEETHRARTTGYTDEAGLVAAGLLVDVSSRHDVTVTGGGAGFTIVPVGECVVASTTAAPTSVATTTAPVATAGPAPTTTAAPGSIALNLTSLCTEPDRYATERRWRVSNPGPGSVPFTLRAVNVTGQPETTGIAPEGPSSWYLPVGSGANTAQLRSGSRTVVKASGNAQCAP